MHVKLFWASVILIAVLAVLAVVTDKADQYLGLAVVVDAMLSLYLWNKIYRRGK